MRIVSLSMKASPVLPDHTGADAALLKLAYCDAVLAAPIGAVEIEHVRPLRTHHADAL